MKKRRAISPPQTPDGFLRGNQNLGIIYKLDPHAKPFFIGKVDVRTKNYTRHEDKGIAKLKYIL